MTFLDKIILTTLLSLLATSAYADTATFQWTLYTDNADGFRLYMDTSDAPINDLIPVDDTTITIPAPTDGECHNFWLRAFKGNLESGNSDIAVVCPKTNDPPLPVPPINVGGFTVTVTVEPN